MSRIKTSRFGTSNRVAFIPDGAAVIGENVYNADGTLFDPAQVSAAPSDTGGEGSGISLDDVGVTGDGLVTVAGFLAEGGVKISTDLARSWVFG